MSNRIRDKAGREWSIDIDVVTVGRVRKELDINLLELVIEGSTLPERLSDPVELVNVLFVLCRDQAEKQGVSDEDFGRSLSIDMITDAFDAVLEGVVDFFPQGIRPAYRKVLEATRRVRTVQSRKVMEVLENPDFDKMIETRINQLLSTPVPSRTSITGDASSLPESSESNHAETPTEP